MDDYSACLHDRGCSCVLITNLVKALESSKVKRQIVAVMAPSLESFSSVATVAHKK